jgi:hypothetical protein
VVKSLSTLQSAMGNRDYVPIPSRRESAESDKSPAEQIELLRSEMLLAAEALDFERAAELRDRIRRLSGDATDGPAPRKRASSGKSSPAKGGRAAPASRARRR